VHPFSPKKGNAPLGGEDPAAVQARLASSFLGRTVSHGLPFVSGRRLVLEKGEYFYGFSHIAAYAIELPPATLTVTVLRDPIQRALSCYNYLRAGDARAPRDWSRRRSVSSQRAVSVRSCLGRRCGTWPGSCTRLQPLRVDRR
jgi:hypothetical protein